MTRLGLFASATALLLAVLAAQNSLWVTTEAETGGSALSACAQVAAGPAGHACAAGQAQVLNYTVFAGGCGAADLHVMRYVPGDNGGQEPIVATWCT